MIYVDAPTLLKVFWGPEGSAYLRDHAWGGPFWSRAMERTPWAQGDVFTWWPPSWPSLAQPLEGRWSVTSWFWARNLPIPAPDEVGAWRSAAFERLRDGMAALLDGVPGATLLGCDTLGRTSDAGFAGLPSPWMACDGGVVPVLSGRWPPSALEDALSDLYVVPHAGQGLVTVLTEAERRRFVVPSGLPRETPDAATLDAWIERTLVVVADAFDGEGYAVWSRRGADVPPALRAPIP